jgi:hypothetical protein
MGTGIVVAPGAVTAPTGAEQAILDVVGEVLGRPGIRLDDDLFDHGATSLSFVRILALINQRYQVMVPIAELTEATPRGLARYMTAEPYREERREECKQCSKPCSGASLRSRRRN